MRVTGQRQVEERNKAAVGREAAGEGEGKEGGGAEEGKGKSSSQS